MKKILCVDDNDFTAGLLRARMEGRGNKFIRAKTADEASRLAEEEVPDLIISEILIPREEDGFRFCQKLKAGRKTAKIPLVLLTARKKDPGASFTYNSWAEEYIEKPFSPRALFPRIEELLAQKK